MGLKLSKTLDDLCGDGNDEECFDYASEPLPTPTEDPRQSQSSATHSISEEPIGRPLPLRAILIINTHGAVVVKSRDADEPHPFVVGNVPDGILCHNRRIETMTGLYSRASLPFRRDAIRGRDLDEDPVEYQDVEEDRHIGQLVKQEPKLPHYKTDLKYSHSVPSKFTLKMRLEASKRAFRSDPTLPDFHNVFKSELRDYYNIHDPGVINEQDLCITRGPGSQFIEKLLMISNRGADVHREIVLETYDGMNFHSYNLLDPEVFGDLFFRRYKNLPKKRKQNYMRFYTDLFSRHAGTTQIFLFYSDLLHWISLLDIADLKVFDNSCQSYITFDKQHPRNPDGEFTEIKDPVLIQRLNEAARNLRPYISLGGRRGERSKRMRRKNRSRRKRKTTQKK